MTNVPADFRISNNKCLLSFCSQVFSLDRMAKTFAICEGV